MLVVEVNPSQGLNTHAYPLRPMTEITSTVVVKERGRITIPKVVLEHFGVEPGDLIEITVRIIQKAERSESSIKKEEQI